MIFTSQRVDENSIDVDNIIRPRSSTATLIQLDDLDFARPSASRRVTS
jgi:hypothetical protein